MNGKIYIIKNSISDDIYIGSTLKDLKNWFKYHKNDCIKERNKNRQIYKHMFENGRGNYNIELLEEYETDNIYNLRLKELEYINNLHPSLNTRMPLTKKYIL
ncbi:unnamed protein product [Symbiodinium sp. KB8]|nr:unnamed protein product [Symbiodinium sp. KB8]